MTETLTSPPATINTSADATDNSQKARPEKPDEKIYKDKLAQAEKEHAAAQEQLVRLSTFLFGVGFEAMRSTLTLVVWFTVSLRIIYIERHQSQDRERTTIEQRLSRW